MGFVLTIVVKPGTANQQDEVLNAAAAALEAVGASPQAPDWLAPGLACDIAFAGADPGKAEAALRERLAPAPVDLAVQPLAGRRKALLVADMDSTILDAESLDALGAAAGLEEEIAAITARTMAGELDFAQSLRARVAMLEGLPAEALDTARSQLRLTPGARSLVQTMTTNGAYSALVSGGFRQFSQWVREACGFDEDHANRLILAEGRLTGQVAEPILDRGAKLDTLRSLARLRGLALSQTCSVGDGANDIDMIEAAGLGVAYHGKPALRAAARFRVDQGDLTTLLYFQGYRQQQIVA